MVINYEIAAPVQAHMVQVNIHSIYDQSAFFAFCKAYEVTEQQFICAEGYLPLAGNTIDSIESAGIEVLREDHQVGEIIVCLERYDDGAYVQITIVNGKLRLYSLKLCKGDYEITYDYDDDDGDNHGIDIMSVINRSLPGRIITRDDDG